MEKMDMRFIALLVVLAVHCECVNIGNGRKTTLEVSNDVKVNYHYFRRWRYIPKEGEKLNDIYRAGQISAKNCLETCYQTANCIAVNFCYKANICHLDGDNAEIARHTQTSSNARCILLKAGLGIGDNYDDRARRDAQWAHYHQQLSVDDFQLDEESTMLN